MVISGKMGLEYSGMATEYARYQKLADINVCREFHVFEVKVTSIPASRKSLCARITSQSRGLKS